MRSLIFGASAFLGVVAMFTSASATLVTSPSTTTTGGSVPLTFSDVPPGAYYYIAEQLSGGTFDGSIVYFSSYFAGQMPTGTDPVTLSGQPTPGSPLTLEYDGSDYVEVTADPASPDSPVLTGAPLDFRQPVSVLFSTPVPFVGVRAGYLDAAGQLTITAYDAMGTSLGSVVSGTVGFQDFGLFDTNGAAMAGLTFQGGDPAGFGIDNLFVANSVNVPEPGTMALLLGGVASLAVVRRRSRRTPD